MEQKYGGDYYDQLQENYDIVSSKRSAYLKAIDQLVIDNVNYIQKHPITWIDIGCGDGKRTKNLYDSLPRIKVLDCIEESNAMANIASEELSGICRRFIHSSVEFASIAENEYNLATCLWNVIGHAKNRHEFLKSIYACLKDDGFLFIDANNRYNISEYGLFAVLKNIFGDLLGISDGFFPLSINGVSTNVYIFNERELRNALSIAGFKKIDVCYVNYRTGLKANRLNGQIVFTAYK